MIDWLSSNQELATLLFTGVVALSTLVYAFLTALLVFETRRLRRAQTDPKVTAFFEPIEEFVNFGHMYVENIGLGPAYDITFTLRPDGCVSGSEMLIADFSKTKFLERGVKYLGPGQKRRSGNTSFPDGYEKKIKAIVIVDISYRNATGREYQEECRLDFSELEGASQLGTPHLYSIAKSLEKMQKDLHHLSTGFCKPRVDIYDREDREAERAEIESRLTRKSESGEGEGNF